MRTTLNIPDDLLAAVREIAKLNKVSVGKAVSTLAREALRQEAAEATIKSSAATANGPDQHRTGLAGNL